MNFPAAVSASPLAVLVDRDVLRSALGRDIQPDVRAGVLESAIIEGLVDAALERPAPLDEDLDLQHPASEPLSWRGVALLVAVAASIVVLTLAT